VKFTVRFRRLACFNVSKKLVAISSVNVFATLDALALHTRKVTSRNFDNKTALWGNSSYEKNPGQVQRKNLVNVVRTRVCMLTPNEASSKFGHL